MALVVDNSVVAGWLVSSQASPYTRRIAALADREAFVVPSLWTSEVANVLLTFVRRGGLAVSQAAAIVRRLERLRIEVDGAQIAPRVLFDLGERHRLSAYDAAYLELAQRRGVPLATRDAALARAARAAGLFFS